MLRAPLLAGLAVLFSLAGCEGGFEPTCRRTCKKLLECEPIETAGVSLDDCADQCSTQENLYDVVWEDQALRDAFADWKRCIRDEECAAIAEGACYDEDLGLWDRDESEDGESADDAEE